MWGSSNFACTHKLAAHWYEATTETHVAIVKSVSELLYQHNKFSISCPTARFHSKSRIMGTHNMADDDDEDGSTVEILRTIDSFELQGYEEGHEERLHFIVHNIPRLVTTTK